MGPVGLTKQGFELAFGINVVGHYLLTTLLTPLLKASPEGGRVCHLGSAGHNHYGARRWNKDYYDNYDPQNDNNLEPMEHYQQSKVATILMARGLSQQHDLDEVVIHPGTVGGTNIAKTTGMWGSFLSSLKQPGILWEAITNSKTPEQGAATTVYCALNPTVERGAYYADCDVAQAGACANHEEDIGVLMEWLETNTQAFKD